MNKYTGSSFMIIACAVKKGKENALNNELKLLETYRKSIVDKSKYHDFIQNYIGHSREKQNAYLDIYNFQLSGLKNNKETDSDSFAKMFLDYRGTYIQIEPENLRFIFKQIIFIFNRQAGNAYFLFRFDWPGITNQKLLKALSNAEFFRFYKRDDTKHKKYKILVSKNSPKQDHNKIQENAEYRIIEIIEMFFPKLHKNLTYYQSKPVMLHIIKNDNSLNEIEHNTAEIAFKILRISKRENSLENYKPELSDFYTLLTPAPSIRISIMNEGALVIDTEEELNSLVNKYLPAFLFAVNQREILINTARKISELNTKSPDIDELRSIKVDLIKLQLQQVFYSISVFNEVALFYQSLQDKFQIEGLMRDNKESIEELHQLIENELEKKLEKQQIDIQKNSDISEKKKENTIAAIFIVVGIAELSSFIHGAMEFNNYPQESFIFLYVIMPVLAGFSIYWLYRNYLNFKNRR